jgi:hypothetical protein
MSIFYNTKITLMHLSNLDMSLNISSTAESALAFATTHEQPFPLPALQSVASAAQTGGLSRDVNLQYDSARFVAVWCLDFVDNSLSCLNHRSETSYTTYSTITRNWKWSFVNGYGIQGPDLWGEKIFKFVSSWVNASTHSEI